MLLLLIYVLLHLYTKGHIFFWWTVLFISPFVLRLNYWNFVSFYSENFSWNFNYKSYLFFPLLPCIRKLLQIYRSSTFELKLTRQQLKISRNFRELFAKSASFKESEKDVETQSLLEKSEMVLRPSLSQPFIKINGISEHLFKVQKQILL